VTSLRRAGGRRDVAGENDDERLVLSVVHQAGARKWRRSSSSASSGSASQRPRVKDGRGSGGGAAPLPRRGDALRDELTLVHPLASFDRYGILVVTEPSRFLRELPETLYERWVLEAGPPALVAPRAPKALAAPEDPTGDATGEDEPVN
jgi:hypothetical protein